MFKRFGKNSKNEKRLRKIKEKLSSDFEIVFLSHPENNPELQSLLYGTNILKAKIDENDEIHLIIISSANGIIYNAITTNYEWFLNEISFTQT